MNDPQITNIRLNKLPIFVTLPNDATIQSSHTCNINIPALPSEATAAHLFPTLGNTSLLSIGQLVDAGCEALFRADECLIQFMGDTILKGHRNIGTNLLWQINLANQSNPHHLANAATTPSATPADLVTFAHATFFSPVLSTLRQAIKKRFISNFPGLTTQRLDKYKPNAVATAKGHMNQQRQGIKSTKPDAPPPLPLRPVIDDETDEGIHPEQLAMAQRTHQCYTAVLEPTGKVFADQTGRFIIPSSTGNNYLMVLYDYDSNSIHAEPMPNRSAKSHHAAYNRAFNRLVKAGLRPVFQMMDNECSATLKQFMDDNNVQLQTTPAGIHRRNSAERAIQTFKNHLISGLCSTDPNFPLHLWDKLIPQSLITLNLLRGSRINTSLSAYAQVFGQYDFNATPMAPPGCHVVVHEKPGDRKTWAPKGKDGWYIGPAMDSYQCYQTWIWETQKIRKADTLAWFPAHLSMPLPTATDLAVAGVNDIAKALTNGSNPTPLAPSEVATLQDLVNIFCTRDQPPTTAAPLLRVEHEPPDEPITFAKTNKHKKRNKPRDKVKAQTPRRSNRSRKPSAEAEQAANTATKAPLSTIPLDPNTTGWLLDLLYLADATRDVANKAVNPDTGKLSDYQVLKGSTDGHHWENSNSDEIGRLAQGRLPNMPNGTNTMHFIHASQIPKGRKATYLRIVCTDRPQKVEIRRVRWTVGGNLIEYPFDVSTKTAGLTTAKILLNSVLSTQNARFMTIDIKDFYLNTPMDRYEYMKIPISVIPDDIKAQYKLEPLVTDGHVYVEIRKGMYGLPQAGRIANDALVPYLATHGYHQAKHTPGLFKHETRPVTFSLVVDNFGVKYVGKEHAQHLLDILSQKYTITTGWSVLADTE